MKRIDEYNNIRNFLKNILESENGFIENYTKIFKLAYHKDSDIRLLLVDDFLNKYCNEKSDLLLCRLINDKDDVVRYKASLAIEDTVMKKSCDELGRRVLKEKDLINKSSFIITYTIVSKQIYNENVSLNFLYDLKKRYYKNKELSLFINAGLVILNKFDYLTELLYELSTFKNEVILYEIILALKEICRYFTEYENNEEILNKIKETIRNYNKTYKNTRINHSIDWILKQ